MNRRIAESRWLAGMLVVGAFGACGSEAQPSLRWSFSFADEETARSAERVEVSIVRGSCSSSDVLYQQSMARGQTANAPPTLGRGRYALVGRALTDGCEVIAYGCEEITLPAQRGKETKIVLAAVPRERVCDGGCASGCEANDAGAPRDGGTPTRDAMSAVSDAAPETDASAGEPTEAGVDGAAPSEDAGVEAGPSLPSCEDGVLSPAQHCYRFITQIKRKWLDAEKDCVSWNGHLVSFNDPAEELWVFQQALTVSGFEDPPSFWIGLNDRDTESVWVWSDGSIDAEPIVVLTDSGANESERYQVPAFVDSYSHFGPNAPAVGNLEPNNTNGSATNPGEDCATVRGDRMSGPNGSGENAPDKRPAWDDNPCDWERFYVCER